MKDAFETTPSHGANGSDEWNDVIRSLAGEENYFFLETNLTLNDERWNYLFLDPEEEICARTSDEVDGSFARIEAGVRDGLYAAGLFSYELGYCFENIFEPPARDGFPLLWVGLYKQPALFNVISGTWPQGIPPGRPRSAPSGSGTPAFSLAEPVLSETYPEYERKIKEIKRRISIGDTYQINHTMRLDFFAGGDPIGLYLDLRRRQKVAYSGMWRKGDMSVLTLSPELYFKIDGDDIEVRPMKGTAPRETFGDKRGAVEFIGGGEKNRAENVMIVDLLRNDLGRIAQRGTVNVPRLFEIEEYETLYQMTSTVRARLSPEAGIHEIFRGLYPSGSVTGAPKISSMKIIRSLERRPRGIYTGAIGFIAPKRRKAVFNVAIRTLSMNGNRGEMGIGGGIVYDSAESEWGEALLKGEFLISGLSDMAPREFSLIETILWTPGSGFFLLEYHMERLSRSARHFGFYFDESNAQRSLESEVAVSGSKPLRIRMLLSHLGGITMETRVADPPLDGNLSRITLSARTVISANPLLRYKTTVRKFYDEELHSYRNRGFFNVIFMNEKGALTEGTITNLVVTLDGEMFTPPLECGLLEGVFRRSLLETGEARERMLYPRDLENAQAIYVCNSVRGLVQVAYEPPDFLTR